MQLTDALCCALLMITMTTTCIQAEGRRHELEERKVDKRLSRRDATVLIDSVPAERAFNNPHVIYRRTSQPRYGPPKPKYGPPRPKYGPPKTQRRPANKHRGKHTGHNYGPSSHKKYGPPSHKNRPQKYRYANKKRPATKIVYAPKKKPLQFISNAYKPEPMGFGEPPSSIEDFRPPHYNGFQKPGIGNLREPDIEEFQSFGDFQKPIASDLHKPGPDFHNGNSNDFFDSFHNQNFNDNPTNQGYGEPPVDSYGAPIKPNLLDLTYPAAQSFPDSLGPLEQDTYNTFKSWKSYQQDQNIDNKYAFSKKQPSFMKPNNDVFVTPVPEDTEKELDLNSYSDIYNYRQMKDKAKKKTKFTLLNQPWKSNHKVKEEDDEIIVGGQYAEPPARYVSKFQPSAPMFTGTDDFGPPGHLQDPELVSSATNSPYVNYKNSNMAFSPQNLNDAFSIVDRNG